MTEQHPMLVAMARAMCGYDLDWRDCTRACLAAGKCVGKMDELDVARSRAALTALLEPTPDMVEAGVFTDDLLPMKDDVAAKVVRNIHGAMIQQALTDPQGAGQTTTATTKGER